MESEFCNSFLSGSVKREAVVHSGDIRKCHPQEGSARIWGPTTLDGISGRV